VSALPPALTPPLPSHEFFSPYKDATRGLRLLRWDPLKKEAVLFPRLAPFLFFPSVLKWLSCSRGSTNNTCHVQLGTSPNPSSQCFSFLSTFPGYFGFSHPSFSPYALHQAIPMTAVRSPPPPWIKLNPCTAYEPYGPPACLGQTNLAARFVYI